jgi:hypothetical protein
VPEVEASARSTSRSAVSRTFVERTRRALDELMSRRLDDVRLAVMMIDGLELQGRTNVVALGITTQGVKIPLGLWEGSTENATSFLVAKGGWVAFFCHPHHPGGHNGAYPDLRAQPGSDGLQIGPWGPIIVAP